jgi:hypothetical protein
MFKKILAICSGCASVFLGACAAHVVMVPSGGSRADGVINMSFELGALRTPEIDWSDAERTATNRCAAWGYSRAEVFGTVERRCTDYSQQNGCVVYQYTAKYQCSGSGGTQNNGQRANTPPPAPAQPPAGYKPCTADQIRQGLCQ